MANHKSAKKCARKAIKRNIINRARISRIRTFVKKAEQSILSANFDQQETLKNVISAEKELMRGVSKGVLHKNTAARKISRIVKKFKLKTN